MNKPGCTTCGHIEVCKFADEYASVLDSYDGVFAIACKHYKYESDDCSGVDEDLCRMGEQLDRDAKVIKELKEHPELFEFETEKEIFDIIRALQEVNERCTLHDYFKLVVEKRVLLAELFNNEECISIFTSGLSFNSLELKIYPFNNLRYFKLNILDCLI